MIFKGVTGSSTVIDLAVLTKDRIDKNTRDDFTFNTNDARMVDIFTAAEKSIVKTGAVIVEDDAL